MSENQRLFTYHVLQGYVYNQRHVGLKTGAIVLYIMFNKVTFVQKGFHQTYSAPSLALHLKQWISKTKLKSLSNTIS